MNASGRVGALVVTLLAGSVLARYLSPEPMLQNPSWVKSEAARGYSPATYAYARNNPIKYIDPTGLYSWRYDCPASMLTGGSRGFVVSKDDVFGVRLVRNSGAVGFDNQFSTACEDLKWMDVFDGASSGLAPVDLIAFADSYDCWSGLRREVAAACAREKQSGQGLQCGPGAPDPRAPPRPPLGG